MNDGNMVENNPGAHPTTEARSILSPQSILAQAVETQVLPSERFKGNPTGEVIALQKIGDTIAALEKTDGHYEVLLNDTQGKTSRFIVDPATKDLGVNLKIFEGSNWGRDLFEVLKAQGFDDSAAKKAKDFWYANYRSRFNDNQGQVTSAELNTKPNLPLPTGEWAMGTTTDTKNNTTKPCFYFVLGKKHYILWSDNDSSFQKLDFNVTGKAENPKIISLNDDLTLKPDGGIFNICDKENKEVASYSGTEPTIDPLNPSMVYFINTGRVYKLDTSGVLNRSTQPRLDSHITVKAPKEIRFDPNGNFLIVRTADEELHIIDRETGDETDTFSDVKGPILIDKEGDIIYVDAENKLREIQTNFQAIPRGGSADAEKKREEQLKALQERFSNLELGKAPKRSGEQISEQDVANTLRETISRQVTEQITTSSDPEILQDILDRLQGLKADPVNASYGQVIDEFVTQARDKLSGIRSAEFDGRLAEYQKALDEVKSVGDTIGLDEQFAKLLELRQNIDITDPQKRREIEKALQTLQEKKDALNTQYQGELVDAARKSLPQLEQLIKETGSSQELVYLSTSTQAQQFEMMLANIKDPQLKRELRDKYNALRSEQRAKLEERGKELAEQDRQRWAQVVEDAREDLSTLREQIEQLSDAKELDRFGRNPLVTAWRAKLFALPPELREIEEKRLEIIMGARKKDVEHRKELGAVGEAGELRFGNVTFPVYKDVPRIWQPKLHARKGGFWADLVFEDTQGKVWRPEGESDVVVTTDPSDEQTKRIIERYRGQADEYFKGIKRRIPDFDEHWKITPFHMEKLEEVAEALNIQLANHRGILILQGEAGTGKNVLADMLANLSNRELVQISCNENTVKEDMTYEFYYDPEKGTYKLPSRLVEGIQTPGIIILLDEINALKPGIAKMLNSLFDYRRRLFLPEGGKEREIIVDPTVIFVGTMNPQNYGGVNRLSPEVKSRARVVDIDYPPFEEKRSGRTYYRSDEAEMLAAYMDDLSELKQNEFRQAWDYVVNRDTSNGADIMLNGNPQLETDIRRVYDVIRVANRLREMYEAYQIGDSNEPMDFPTSLREVTDIVMEMNHRQGVKKMIKRVIVPKIDDRRQKKLVEDTIDAVLPDTQ